jgi:hypothetical protein
VLDTSARCKGGLLVQLCCYGYASVLGCAVVHGGHRTRQVAVLCALHMTFAERIVSAYGSWCWCVLV